MTTLNFNISEFDSTISPLTPIEFQAVATQATTTPDMILSMKTPLTFINNQFWMSTPDPDNDTAEETRCVINRHFANLMSIIVPDHVRKMVLAHAIGHSLGMSASVIDNDAIPHEAVTDMARVVLAFGDFATKGHVTATEQEIDEAFQGVALDGPGGNLITGSETDTARHYETERGRISTVSQNVLTAIGGNAGTFQPGDPSKDNAHLATLYNSEDTTGEYSATRIEQMAKMAHFSNNETNGRLASYFNTTDILDMSAFGGTDEAGSNFQLAQQQGELLVEGLASAGTHASTNAGIIIKKFIETAASQQGATSDDTDKLALMLGTSASAGSADFTGTLGTDDLPYTKSLKFEAGDSITFNVAYVIPAYNAANVSNYDTSATEKTLNVNVVLQIISDSEFFVDPTDETLHSHRFLGNVDVANN
jgi:hypothetical protein